MKAKYDFSKLSKKKEVKRGCWLTGFLVYTTIVMIVYFFVHLFLVSSVPQILPYAETSELMLYVWYIGLTIVDVIAIICMVGLVSWKLWGFIGVEGYFLVLAVYQFFALDLFGLFQVIGLFFILGYLLSTKMQKFK